MGEFTPKVTIELSEYEYLKDVKYQALDLLKSKIKIKCFNDFGDPVPIVFKGPGVLVSHFTEVHELHLDDIKTYLHNLFGKEIMIIQNTPSKGE